MASENETVEDVVKEMRQVGPYPIYKKPIFANPKSISESYAKRFMYGHFVTDFGTVVIENPKVKDVSNYELASRIEAAHKREVAELKEYLKASAVGAKAMREEIAVLRNMITDLRAKLKIAINILEKISYGDGTLSDFSGLAELTLAEIREEGGAK